MARRKSLPSFPELAQAFAEKLRAPLGVILGGPREVAECLKPLAVEDVTCVQMDLFQGNRLEQELAANQVKGKVVVQSDLWDVEAPLRALLYPVPQRGERILKLDMLEQAYHVLQPGGTLVVLSHNDKDTYLPQVLKKIFGKVHAPAAAQGCLFWCQRGADRPRRRHEVTFQVSRGDQPSLRFLSRPGTFSYGRFDEGARALVQVMEIEAGNRILDLGCGCGTNGIHAGLQAGPTSHVTFVDSNLRALALTATNAKANGLQNFDCHARSQGEGLPARTYDVALANPPYFAQGTIAQMFLQSAVAALKPGGRLFLVTKQPDQVWSLMEETFADVELVEHRGYIVFCATAR